MSGLNSYDEEQEDLSNRGVDRTKLLPPEILTEIFRFSSVFAEYQFLEPHHSPWILGQICSGWRAIALSTPKLWCFLPLVSSNSVESLPITSILSLVSTYIERSGQLPLKLALDARWSQGQKAPLLDLLLSQSHRWGGVSIYLLDERQRLGGSILAALQRHSFALQSLQFRFCDITALPLIIELPNLTSLTLTSSGVDLLEHLSTSGLQHFCLESSFLGSDKPKVHSFLRKCASSLTRLELIRVRLDDHELLDMLNILLNLTELGIYCEILGPIVLSEAFLLGLHSQKTVPCVLPKLKHLSLGNGGMWESNDLLLDVLESRCPEYGNDEMACAPLLSVQLHSFEQFDRQARARFRALSDSGMDVGVFVFEAPHRRWVSVKEPEMEMDSEGSGEEARRGEM